MSKRGEDLFFDFQSNPWLKSVPNRGKDLFFISLQTNPGTKIVSKRGKTSFFWT